MKKVFLILVLLLAIITSSSCNKPKMIVLEDDLTICVGESININDYEIDNHKINYSYQYSMEQMYQVGDINVASMGHNSGIITGLKPGSTYQAFAYVEDIDDELVIIKVILNLTVVKKDNVYVEYNQLHNYQKIQLVTGAIHKFVIIKAVLTPGCYNVHLKNDKLSNDTHLIVEGYPQISFNNDEAKGFISISEDNEYEFVIKLDKDADISELDVMFEKMK